jgi:hypothetical protein
MSHINIVDLAADCVAGRRFGVRVTATTPSQASEREGKGDMAQQRKYRDGDVVVRLFSNAESLLTHKSGQ